MTDNSLADALKEVERLVQELADPNRELIMQARLAIQRRGEIEKLREEIDVLRTWAFDDGTFNGYKIYNCCGSFRLAVRKQPKPRARFVDGQWHPVAA